MTPAQHAAKADLLVTAAKTAEDEGRLELAEMTVLRALVHAVLALAGELGVPMPASTEVTSDAGS